MAWRWLFLVSLGSWLVAGCTSISVAPSCPSDLRVGESGTLQANESHAGAVPTYKWEAVPADAVTLESPTASATKVDALKAGDVLIRLTASDSLFQTVSECHVVITQGGSPTVLLTIDPSQIAVGDSAVLFCASTGEAAAVTRTLSQVDGPAVTLDSLSEGVATITPDELGDFTFNCVGGTADGVISELSVATLTVVAVSDGTNNGNTNGNVNDNTAGDGGTTDNSNDNGGRTPRGGRSGRG